MRRELSKKTTVVGALAAVLLGLVMVGCKEHQELSTRGGAPSAASGKARGSVNFYRVSTVAAGGSTFRVEPASGYKINVEFPWKMVVPGATPLGAGAGIALESSAATVTMPESLRGGDGPWEVRGDFSVCNDDECKIFRDEPITVARAAGQGGAE